MHYDWLELALRQAGVISTRQLSDAGVSRYRLEALVAAGVLRRAGRGVFVCTFCDQFDLWARQLWVAVISAGPGAVAFRQSAAAWWSLDGCPRDCVEVAIPPGRQSRLQFTHRPSELRGSHMTSHLGMPVTTAARTLADLGSAASDLIVERALESALRRRLVTISELESLLVTIHVSGGKVLRRILDGRPTRAPATESDAETIFLQLARSSGLCEPRRQYVLILGGRKYRLDFAWPHLRIAVEIDGAEVHATPGALRSDLLRQNQILLDGWAILRFTWYDLINNPQTIVRRDLLSAWTMKGGPVPAAI